jgi:hypothetical protein
MSNTITTTEQEEIASFIIGRFQHLEKDRIRLEARMRSLVEDLQHNQQWLYEVRQEAREAGVELD